MIYFLFFIWERERELTTYGNQKRASDLQEVQLQVVEPLAWLLDTDLRSSGKAASLLTSEAAPVGNDLISHTHLTSLL